MLRFGGDFLIKYTTILNVRGIFVFIFERFLKMKFYYSTPPPCESTPLECHNFLVPDDGKYQSFTKARSSFVAGFPTGFISV